MAVPSSEPQPSAARNIYAFGLTSFLNDTATEMAYWVLPAFLVSLGAGPAQLGLIEGLAESVASFAKLFSGYLTDRLDRRNPLVVLGQPPAPAQHEHHAAGPPPVFTIVAPTVPPPATPETRT